MKIPKARVCCPGWQCLVRACLVAGLLLAGSGTAHGLEATGMDVTGMDEEQLRERLEKKINKLVLPRLTGEATIDAVLDEPFWQYAAVQEIKYETFPTKMAPAPVKTVVRIARLQDYLLLSFVCEDPDPDKIQAPWKDRDGIDMDDYVSLLFDPAGKNIRTYELKVSASGIQGDQMRSRMDNKLLRDWDAVWESEARITADGYIVEMKIPAAEFDFPMHSGVRRILIFKRHYPREVKRTLSALSVIKVEEGTPGIEDKVLIIPTATFVYERERPLDGEDRSWESNDNPTISLDMAYKLTPSMTFLGTVNPNYLQVEADLSSSSINNGFTDSFEPEKRRFFAASKDTFSSLFNLVYTPNIVEPNVGAKLAGSVKDHTTGNFVVHDKALKLYIPGNLGSKKKEFASESTSGALRYRYDFRRGLSLGAIATGRAGDSDSDISDYQSFTTGIDGYAKVARFDEIRVQWVASSMEYPEAIVDKLCENEGECDDPEDDSGLPNESSYNEQVLRADPDRTYRDDALWLTFKHWQPEWFFIARYIDVGEDFRGDLGYMKKIDYRLGSVSGGYTWFLGQGAEDVRRLRLSSNIIKSESQAGELLMDSIDVQVNYWGLNQGRIRIGYRNRNRVAKRFLQNTLDIEGNAPEFNEDQIFFRIENSPLRNINFILTGYVGEEIDKDNYRLGDVLELAPELRWYVGDSMELSLKNSFKQLDVKGGRLFTENYLRLSLTYEFPKGSFARFTFIDDYVSRNTDLYLYEGKEALERETSGELLFAWKPGKGNLFLAGLQGGAVDSGELDGPTFNNWLFYVKYSRAFRW